MTTIVSPQNVSNIKTKTIANCLVTHPNCSVNYVRLSKLRKIHCVHPREHPIYSSVCNTYTVTLAPELSSFVSSVGRPLQQSRLSCPVLRPLINWQTLMYSSRLVVYVHERIYIYMYKRAYSYRTMQLHPSSLPPL